MKLRLPSLLKAALLSCFALCVTLASAADYIPGTDRIDLTHGAVLGTGTQSGNVLLKSGTITFLGAQAGTNATLTITGAILNNANTPGATDTILNFGGAKGQTIRLGNVDSSVAALKRTWNILDGATLIFTSAATWLDHSNDTVNVRTGGTLDLGSNLIPTVNFSNEIFNLEANGVLKFGLASTVSLSETEKSIFRTIKNTSTGILDLTSGRIEMTTHRVVSGLQYRVSGNAQLFITGAGTWDDAVFYISGSGAWSTSDAARSGSLRLEGNVVAGRVVLDNDATVCVYNNTQSGSIKALDGRGHSLTITPGINKSTTLTIQDVVGLMNTLTVNTTGTMNLSAVHATIKKVHVTNGTFTLAGVAAKVEQLHLTGGSATVNSIVSGGSIDLFTADVGTTIQLKANFVGAEAMKVIKDGDGAMEMSGVTATRTGATEIRKGTLSVANMASLGSGKLSLSAGATFSYTGDTAAIVTNSLSTGSGGSLNVNNAAAVVAWDLTEGTRTGTISKSGAGTLRITAGDMATSAATIVLEGGLLELLGTGSFGTAWTEISLAGGNVTDRRAGGSTTIASGQVLSVIAGVNGAQNVAVFTGNVLLNGGMIRSSASNQLSIVGNLNIGETGGTIEFAPSMNNGVLSINTLMLTGTAGLGQLIFSPAGPLKFFLNTSDERLVNGTYTLISAAGGVVGWNESLLSLSGSAAVRKTAVFTKVGNNVNVTISGEAPTLTWTGKGSVWQTWKEGDSTQSSLWAGKDSLGNPITETAFQNFDNASFLELATGFGSQITVNGTVRASIMLIDNTTTPYRFQGGGTIFANSLEKRGSGTAIIQTSGLSILDKVNLLGGKLELQLAPVAPVDTDFYVGSGTELVLKKTGSNDELRGVISGSGQITLSFASTARVYTISSNNSFSGTWMVEKGVELQLASAAAIGAYTSFKKDAIILNGGILSYRRERETAMLASNVGITLVGTSQIVTDTDSILSINGVISGSGQLTKSGRGTLILHGANSYTGGTVISGGVLLLDTNGTLGTGTLSFTNAGRLAAATGVYKKINSTLNISGANITLGDNIYNGVLDFVNAVALMADTSLRVESNVIWSKGVSGVGNLIVDGTGTFTLAGYMGGYDRDFTAGARETHILAPAAGFDSLNHAAGDLFIGSASVSSVVKTIDAAFTSVGSMTLAKGSTLEILGGRQNAEFRFRGSEFNQYGKFLTLDILASLGGLHPDGAVWNIYGEANVLGLQGLPDEIVVTDTWVRVHAGGTLNIGNAGTTGNILGQGISLRGGTIGTLGTFDGGASWIGQVGIQLEADSKIDTRVWDARAGVYANYSNSTMTLSGVITGDFKLSVVGNSRLLIDNNGNTARGWAGTLELLDAVEVEATSRAALTSGAIAMRRGTTLSIQTRNANQSILDKTGLLLGGGDVLSFLAGGPNNKSATIAHRLRANAGSTIVFDGVGLNNQFAAFHVSGEGEINIAVGTRFEFDNLTNAGEYYLLSSFFEFYISSPSAAMMTGISSAYTTAFDKVFVNGRYIWTLKLDYVAESLVWRSSSSSAEWDSIAWSAAGLPSTVAWSSGKNVQFDDSMKGNKVVSVNDNVRAGSINVGSKYDLTISGASLLSGSLLTKNGSGTLTLGVVTDLTNGIRLENGTLMLAKANVLNGKKINWFGGTLGVTIDFTLDSTNAGNLTLNLGDQRASLNVGAGAILTAAENTFDGDRWNRDIVKLGAGQLLLTLEQGSNISRDVSIEAGELAFFIGAGEATYRVTDFSSLTGAGTLVKKGAGTLVVTSDPFGLELIENTYSGGTRVEEGVLQLGSGVRTHASIGTGTLTMAQGTTLRTSTSRESFENNLAFLGDNTYEVGDRVFNGGVDRVWSGSVSIAGTVRLIGTVGVEQSLIWSGLLSGDSSASIDMQGNVDLSLTNANNTFAGTVNVVGNLNLFSGALSNASALNLSNAAILTWTGGNFADHLKHIGITGTNTINLGGRTVTVDQLTANASALLTVAGKGTLLVHGGTGGTNELELTASTWTMERAVLSGNITQTGVLTLGAATMTSLMEVSGNYEVLGNALIGTGVGSSSFLSINSTGQFAYSGVSALTVGSGENSYGQIKIEAEGIFNYTSTGAFNLSSTAGATGELVVKGIFSTSRQVTSGGGTAKVFFDGGLLRSSQGTSVDVFGANISVFIQAGGLNVEVVDNATTTISSTLQGGQNQHNYAQWMNGVRVNGSTYFNADGGLNKVGAGNLNLTGNNTFKGGVRLKEGVLQIASGAALGAAGFRNLTVSDAATLDFAADIEAPVINSLTVQAAGVFSLGTDHKTLTLGIDGMTTFAANSTFVMDIVGGADSASDTLNMNSLTLQGDLVLELVQTTMTAQSRFTLMTLTGAFVGLDSQIKIDVSKEIRGFEIKTHKTLSVDKELQIEVVNQGTAGKGVTWAGANGDTWTTGATGEWKLGDKKTNFYNQDSIVFNGKSTKAQTVNTKGNLVTGDITISGTPQYIFNGTGVITALADTTLTKSGDNEAIWNVATVLQNVIVTGGNLTLTKGSIEGSITVGGTNASLSIAEDMVIKDTAGTIVTLGAAATINLNGKLVGDADFFTLDAAKNTLMNMSLTTALHGSHAVAQSLVLDGVQSAASVYGGSLVAITGTVGLTIANGSSFQANVYGGSNGVNLTGLIKDFSFNGVTITGQQLATEVNVSGFSISPTLWLFAGSSHDAVSALTGSTLMKITGGTFGSIAGGSQLGVMTGNSYITVGVTDGSSRASLPSISIVGNLVGGSVGGTFTGSTNIIIGDNVSITGGVIGSSVAVDGTTLASITGSSNIMISGGASITGPISAGLTTGGSTITLKNVAEGSNMAQYKGTISGGTGGTTRTLVLDNYDSALLASLSGFTNISVTNNSDLTLSLAQAGLAGSTWTLAGNSRVTLADANGFGGDTSRLVMSGATLNLNDFAVGNVIDITGGTNFLNGVTNYTGAITSSGSLTLGSTLGATATITLTGGSLSMGTNAIKNDITIASGDVSLSGINYQGTLVKNGTGTLTLQTSLAQTAKIQLNAGTLDLNGKNVSNQIDIAAGGVVTMKNHTQFTGSLSVGAAAALNVSNLTMKTGQVLDFLGAGTITGGLTLSGGTLNTHVVGGTLGGIAVDSLAITELSLVSITDGTTLANGDYTLMTGTLTGADLLKLTGFKGTRTSASLGYSGTTLTLTITQGDLLTWKDSGAIWDTTATDSWTNNGDVVYKSKDHVLFAGAVAQTIDITTTVTPGSMEVDSTAGYVFTGQGVQSAGRLIKRNTGSLTFSNAANAFDAGMNILAGNVLVTGDSSLSSAFDGDTVDVTNSLLSAGASISFESTGSSVIDNLNGAGSLKLSSGQLSLGRTASFKGGLFTGTVEVTGGNLILNDAGAIASTNVTIKAGKIDNVNYLADNSLSVVATGNVVLTGDLTGKISNFSTVDENARITVGRSITLATATFELGFSSLVQMMKDGVVSSNQYTSIVSIGSENTLTLDKLVLNYTKDRKSVV